MANPHDQNDDADDAGSVGEHPPVPPKPSNRIVPDAVAQRFLRIDNRYFFADRTLAFVDDGDRLKVRTHNLEVVHSVVAIIQARGWQTIRVTGTKEFRQKVWHEATMRGIGVQGYEPDPLEMQQLQRALDRDSTRHLDEPARDTQDKRNKRDKRDTRATRNNASNPKEASPTGPSIGLRTGMRPPIVGRLLAHAAAPYQFDPTQRMSYYVCIQTEVGERTLWGTDLERAIAESRSAAQVGDEVVLAQRGARAVTVRVPARNAEGELVGDKKLVAQRMTWGVEKVHYLEALERKASLFRTGEVSPVDFVSQFPDLTGAVVGMKLAEQFAQRLTPDAADQARVVQAIRTSLADAIAQGQQIRLPAQREHQNQVHHRNRSGPSREDLQHVRSCEQRLT
ncbi:MAG: LPD7 domain-containing protein [Steroidobacteraceae bacterium]